MYKIRKIKYQGHPILKDLELDFCGKDGNAIDTIILAGENGTGKSTILNTLYEISTYKVNYPMTIELEHDEEIVTIRYYLKELNNGGSLYYINDGRGMDEYIGNNNFKHKYQFSGIFSDVDIIFHAREVSNVTSMTLDSAKGSQRSTENLPTQINQLIVDIQSDDDSNLADAVRKAVKMNRSINNLSSYGRMSRFTFAFNKIFENLTYSRIKTIDGKKVIVFQKNGEEISIDDLSSGEKQIVYRGCFLLKDKNSTNGAFVFIDEPEISLHPNWQKKIVDYYKSIFSDENRQTSQIFIVTHSPFIIHNDTRRDDKVLILSRNDKGDIIVNDKPEYYKCNSIEAVEDAFKITFPFQEQSIVYLEGRTDERYFNRALEVYGYNVKFQFKWIGNIDSRGEEVNTGKEALNKAVCFLRSRNLKKKSVCLYDCDAAKKREEINNIITMSIPKFTNSAGINVGIENALVLDGIDLEPYKKYRESRDGYGMLKKVPDFQKMHCCEDICKLDPDRLKAVFSNLKTVIDELASIFDDDNEEIKD